MLNLLFGSKYSRPCRFRPSDYLEIEVHYPFVGLLNQKDKGRFYRRLCALMRSVELVEKGVELTREDRLLIAAPAVILTMGYRRFHAGNFDMIYVYPTAYRRKDSHQYFHGETSPMGVIVVNWKRVKEGIEDPDDAMHLLYHEYAHAFMISKSAYRFREDKYFVKLVNKHLTNMLNSQEVQNSNLLRPYSLTNEHEFFACVIEEMMERADILKQEHPEVYHLFLKLLKFEPYEDLLLRQAMWYR